MVAHHNYTNIHQNDVRLDSLSTMPHCLITGQPQPISVFFTNRADAAHSPSNNEMISGSFTLEVRNEAGTVTHTSSHNWTGDICFDIPSSQALGTFTPTHGYNYVTVYVTTRNGQVDGYHQNDTISDILNMTINQAVEFFQSLPKQKIIDNIIARLTPLQDVGLGYLKMGQSSSTLSGGEAQRVKLAYYLSLGSNQQNTLFIFDEPTTGLHFHDIHKLYEAFNRLIEKGNSILVIEHNLELIKCADWVIDLGPEGGDQGGKIIFEGKPEDLVKSKKSHTGQALQGKV